MKTRAFLTASVAALFIMKIATTKKGSKMKRLLMLGFIAWAALMSPLPVHTEPLTAEEMKAGSKIYEYTRFVPPGKKMMLNDLGFMSPNCTIEEIDAAVTKDADHGLAAVEIVERNVVYPSDSPYHKCNEKRKFSIPTVSYKPAVGYSGMDAFEVTVISPAGLKFIYRYTINVIDRKKGRADIR